jgi:TonB family protein
MKALILASVGSLLAGCMATSHVAGDRIESGNSYSASAHEPQKTQSSGDEKDRLARLFSDQPEYAALALRNDAAATKPTLRTSLPPNYPPGLKFSDTKALIKVAVVISESGSVAEARIYEASDPRFTYDALEAVRDWTFHPGARNGVPAKFLLIMPIHFDGRQK